MNTKNQWLCLSVLTSLFLNLIFSFSASAQTNATVATVRVAALNVRSGPGISYSRIDLVRNGDHLTVIGQVNNCAWLQITTSDNGMGWVTGNARYVTLNVPCTQIAVVEDPTPTGQATTGQATAAPEVLPVAGAYATAHTNYGLFFVIEPKDRSQLSGYLISCGSRGWALPTLSGLMGRQVAITQGKFLIDNQDIRVTGEFVDPVTIKGTIAAKSEKAEQCGIPQTATWLAKCGEPAGIRSLFIDGIAIDVTAGSCQVMQKTTPLPTLPTSTPTPLATPVPPLITATPVSSTGTVGDQVSTGTEITIAGGVVAVEQAQLTDKYDMFSAPPGHQLLVISLKFIKVVDAKALEDTIVHAFQQDDIYVIADDGSKTDLDASGKLHGEFVLLFAPKSSEKGFKLIWSQNAPVDLGQ